jgi:hypothetical protein
MSRANRRTGCCGMRSMSMSLSGNNKILGIIGTRRQFRF